MFPALGEWRAAGLVPTHREARLRPNIRAIGVSTTAQIPRLLSSNVSILLDKIAPAWRV